jgi:hypothetical protein
VKSNVGVNARRHRRQRTNGTPPLIVSEALSFFFFFFECDEPSVFDSFTIDLVSHIHLAIVIVIVAFVIVLFSSSLSTTVPPNDRAPQRSSVAALARVANTLTSTLNVGIALVGQFRHRIRSPSSTRRPTSRGSTWRHGRSRAKISNISTPNANTSERIENAPNSTSCSGASQQTAPTLVRVVSSICAVAQQPRHAKVANFHHQIVRAGQQHVARRNVAMNHTMPMQMRHTTRRLARHTHQLSQCKVDSIRAIQTRPAASRARKTAPPVRAQCRQTR